MFPPHLPPPASSIARHRQFERIKIILTSSVFGILAGLSGAAVLVGYIWPMFVDSSNIYRTRSVSNPREQLQAKAQQKISEQIFTVFKQATTAGKVSYFSESDRIGEGVASVTSGWIIMYLPNFDGRTQTWVAVAENGSLFKVSKSLFDKRSGLAYIKIEPKDKTTNATDRQFKVAIFNNDLKQYDEVFVYSGGRWQSTMVTGNGPGPEAAHLDTASPYLFALTDSFKNGSIAIDSSGNVAGFIVQQNLVMSQVNENYFLNGIDEKKQITYPSLGVEGWYSDEKLLVINEEKISGFIVAKVDNNKQFFQKGDIILEINGRSATRDNMWYNMNGQRARVSVWRNGNILENQVQILEL